MTLNGGVPTEAGKYPDAKHHKHSKSNDHSAAELFPLRRDSLRHVRFLSIGNLLSVLLFRYCLSAARYTQFLKLLIRDFPLFLGKWFPPNAAINRAMSSGLPDSAAASIK